MDFTDDSDSDGDADRTTYLLGAIKVRDGCDHTKAFESGTMSLDELEKLWRTLTKVVLPTKAKKSKTSGGKSKGSIEGEPPRYAGVSFCPAPTLQFCLSILQITPSTTDHPMKKKANSKNGKSLFKSLSAVLTNARY
jgi:hypothetical protein